MLFFSCKEQISNNSQKFRNCIKRRSETSPEAFVWVFLGTHQDSHAHLGTRRAFTVCPRPLVRTLPQRRRPWGRILIFLPFFLLPAFDPGLPCCFVTSFHRDTHEPKQRGHRECDDGQRANQHSLHDFFPHDRLLLVGKHVQEKSITCLPTKENITKNIPFRSFELISTSTHSWTEGERGGIATFPQRDVPAKGTASIL